MGLRCHRNSLSSVHTPRIWTNSDGPSVPVMVVARAIAAPFALAGPTCREMLEADRRVHDSIYSALFDSPATFWEFAS
eukprot:1141230-Pleurochrysis_carterae.AAC.1